MNNEYRKLLIDVVNRLIEVRHDVFGDALNLAMNNELSEVDDAFEEGDTYHFELNHLEDLNDSNIKILVDLIKSIEKTVDSITNVNRIEDSELNSKR